MKAVRAVGALVVCGVVMVGSTWGADVKVVRDIFRRIADVHSLIVATIRDQNAEDSAATGIGAMKAQFEAGLPAQDTREHCIGIVTYGVVSKGLTAAPMMGIWDAAVPPAQMPFVAATAVVAGGDNSPGIAKAMIDAVGAGNAQAGDVCRAACADPSTVLSPSEMGIIRGIMLTSSPASATASPMWTTLRPAEKYSGQ